MQDLQHFLFVLRCHQFFRRHFVKIARIMKMSKPDSVFSSVALRYISNEGSCVNKCSCSRYFSSRIPRVLHYLFRFSSRCCVCFMFFLLCASHMFVEFSQICRNVDKCFKMSLKTFLIVQEVSKKSVDCKRCIQSSRHVS